MSKHFRRDSRIHQFSVSSDADEAYKIRHAPQFKSAEQYIQAKLKMLVKDFRIKPTETEIKHLHELSTESEINRAIRQIIVNHWG